MLVDIHAKSSISPDCELDVNDVVKQAVAAGLDAIAFCETLSSSRCQEALDACSAAGILGLIGVEIPTDMGMLVGFVPEIGEFYLSEEWRQLTDLTTPPASEVIKLFKQKGGVVIASRPYDLEIPYNMGDLIFTLDGIRAVEVFNNRVGQLQSDFALEAALSMNLQTVGGSDPNTEAKRVGDYATFFDVEFNTQSQFVDALLEAEFWAVQLGNGKQKKTSRPDSGRRSDSDRGGRGGSGGGGGRGGRSGGGRGDSRGGSRSGGRGRDDKGRGRSRGGDDKRRGRSKRD